MVGPIKPNHVLPTGPGLLLGTDRETLPSAPGWGWRLLWFVIRESIQPCPDIYLKCVVQRLVAHWWKTGDLRLGLRTMNLAYLSHPPRQTWKPTPSTESVVSLYILFYLQLFRVPRFSPPWGMMQIPMWELLLPAGGSQRTLNKSPVSPLPGITVTNWPARQCCQLRADRLTDSCHTQSAAHTHPGRRGVGNRCAGLAGRWQLLPHQHSSQHRVPPALMSLRQQVSPGSRGGFPGAHGDRGLLRREGLPGL